MELVTLKEISMILAVWVAIYGIDSWRREYIGKRRMKLAEQILALFYEAKDVISYIRHPFSFVGEGGSRTRNERETEEETKLYDRAFVAFERYEKHKDVFNRIRSLRYQLMALHGTDASKPFDDLDSVVNEIFGASRRLSRYWLQQGRREMEGQQLQEHLQRMHEAEAIFWEGTEDPDPITPRVDGITLDIEGICKPIIESRSTLFGIVNKKIFSKNS